MLHRITKVFLLIAVLVSGVSFAKIEPLDRIVAVVNDGIVTQKQLDMGFNEVKQQLARSDKALPSDAALKKQVLDKLILDEIQVQYAERTGIIIDDQSLDSMISSIAKQNNMSITEFRRALDAEGLDYKLFRDQIKRQHVISQLHQRDVVSEVKVSNTEVKQFLNSAEGQSLQGFEYKLSHILVSLPDTPTPQDIQNAKARAQDIMQKVEQGADFSQTAFSESSGANALSGGELGWRALPAVPTIFVDEVATMNKSDIRGPIRSPSGFHIVKLLDKRMMTQENTIDKTRVRHILIKPNALLSDLEAQMRLEDIVRDIENGKDFGVLAKTYSEDLASGSQGGDLGWVTQDQLVEEFSTTMNETPIGKISKPFRSTFGWHILEVLDRKKENNLDEIIKLNAENMIRNRKVEERLENYLRQMRDEAYVKVNLSEFSDETA